MRFSSVLQPFVARFRTVFARFRDALARSLHLVASILLLVTSILHLVGSKQHFVEILRHFVSSFHYGSGTAIIMVAVPLSYGSRTATIMKAADKSAAKFHGNKNFTQISQIPQKAGAARLCDIRVVCVK